MIYMLAERARFYDNFYFPFPRHAQHRSTPVSLCQRETFLGNTRLFCSDAEPTDIIPDLIRMVKAESSKWIKGELNRTAFAWQDGYGVFSASASGLEAVRGYVLGQEEHHRTRTFQEEYLAMLKKSGVGYDERYLW